MVPELNPTTQTAGRRLIGRILSLLVVTVWVLTFAIVGPSSAAETDGETDAGTGSEADPAAEA